jgi:hypothetical protein
LQYGCSLAALAGGAGRALQASQQSGITCQLFPQHALHANAGGEWCSSGVANLIQLPLQAAQPWLSLRRCLQDGLLDDYFSFYFISGRGFNFLFL